MRYGSTFLDTSAAGSLDIEANVARALVGELYCDAYQAGRRWAVDPDNLNRLTDGFRTVTVYVDRSVAKGARVNLIGELHGDVYTGVPERSRYRYRPRLVRASVALERGPTILAREVRRRVLPQLDTCIVAVRAAIRRDLDCEATTVAARARLEPVVEPSGRIYRSRPEGDIYGSASVNVSAGTATFDLTVPLDVAERIAALIAGLN